MAVAPLGKCIVLPLLLLLFYVGYGFRIRDGPVGSIEQQHQHGACTAGKCPGEAQVTLGGLKKRTETSRTGGRIGGLRQPPVAGEQDGEVTEHVRSRLRVARWGFKEPVKEEKQESEDDEEDGIVEDEVIGSDETEEINMDDDDDDNDDDDDDEVDDEDEDDTISEEEVPEEFPKEALKKEVKWHFRTVTKVAKEEEEDERDHTGSSTINKLTDEGESKYDNNESDEIDEKDESPKGEDETDEVPFIQRDQKETSERKLEKVRFADKGKVKSVELPLSDEKNATSAKEKLQAEVVKQKDSSTLNEVIPKEIEVSQAAVNTKSKEKTTKRPITKEGGILKEEQPVKKQDNKDVKEKEKPKGKNSESSKVSEKVDIAEEKPKKAVDKAIKVKEKTEKAKEKTDVKDKANQKKSKAKAEDNKSKPEVKSNKESEQSAKKPVNQKNKSESGSITLAELNDAILHMPNFFPNFTAVDDPVCQQHGKIFLRQLRGRKLWALQMLDSSAKIPSGLLRGNVNQFGDFDQCLGVSSKVRLDDKQTLKIQGKYCLASIDIQATLPDTKVPVHLMQSRGFLRGNMRDSGHFVPKFTTISWALCIPSACSADDAKSAIQSGLSQLNITSGIKFVVDVNPDMCYVQQKTLSYSKETIGVLYFFAMIICIVLVATVRDYIVVSEKASYSEHIIMSFSLRRTLKSLTKPTAIESGDISCIHGIRSLATMALYVGHKMIPTAGMPFTNRVVLTEVANNPMSSLLRVSLVYTDSFLLLSGVLSAFNMTHESNTRGEIRWFCRFIARIIRLTPPLLVVVFWYAFVMEHTGSGPQWNNIIKPNADLCKQNLWTNILYIQNFFPFEEMCATHTHQLALDMQLSLFAPVLVFFLQVKPIIGVLLIFFFLQVSATLRYFATVNNYLSLVIFHGMTAKHLYKTANLTYALSLHRATPYLFGVGLGVLLNYTGKNIKIYKIFVMFGWLIAAFLGCWSLFSPWKMARRDYIYDVEEAAHYAVIGPVSWALALCWIIFACFTGHGGFVNRFLSSYLLVLFSRISYSVYLIQFAVFFYNLATTRYSSEFQIHKVIDPYEASTVILLSVILTLFLDIPTQEVKKVLMESTDVSQSEVIEEKHPSRDPPKKTRAGSRKPSKTPEPEVYKARLRNDLELDYSEEEDPHWLSRKPNGKQRIFVRGNSKEEDYRPWGFKRDEERRRSSSTQRMVYGEPESILRSATPSRHIDDLRRERRSASRTLDASLRGSYGSEDRRRDRSNSRLSDRTHYREPETVARTPVKSESRGKSPRLRRTPVRLMSSGSEEESLKFRGQSSRRPVERPRVSDEEAWEQELRIRRQKFREQEAFDGPEPKLERDESTDLSRRSSAEGKIALLQGPTEPSVMDAWTVSKGPRVSIGSSQEPTDTEEESRYRRDFGEEPNMERRQSLDSMSHEEADFSFKITDSKTKTMMDLRQISSEEDDHREIVGEMTPVPTGKLFKRESIIKSQASEEDPEYLLPERPKLVEQEQEHPFRKAWQMQKSRSEEDGPAAFAIKERRSSGEIPKDNRKKSPSPPSTNQTFQLIVEDVDSGNWRTLSQESRSSVTESSEDLENEEGVEEEQDEQSSRQATNDIEQSSRMSSRSNGTESPHLDWPNEEEQFDRYRRQRRNFENWEQESDET